MRQRVGTDEIRYEEPATAAAEVVAAALPEVRRRAEEVVGLTAPVVRVVMSSRPPAVWQYYRPTPSLVGWVTGVTAGTTLAAMFVRWVLAPRYPFAMLLPAAALMAVAPRFRTRGLIPFLVGLILLAAAWPPLIPLLALLVVSGTAVATARSVRRTWPFLGGFSFVWGHLLRPAIALHWPPPVRVAAVDYLLYHPFSTEDRARSYLAHEFAHVLLHLHCSYHPPAWLDEGFAFWLSEQVTGVMVYRPESRECISEPEPSKDVRRQFAGQESYYRLMARYYWEVRALAEAGRLPEVFAALAEEVTRLRPSLAVTAEQPAGGH